MLYLVPNCLRGVAASSLLFSASLLCAQETIVPAEMLAVPDDLEVTVWAQSPDLRNPTNMDIDHSGRIWVAEGVNYRWSNGRDPKGDRITVLEDTNGDGKADKSWTFVQEPGLIAPLGVAVIDNKIYVSNAPDLIVYTDVDRNLVFDPRIDRREVLLTGFNGRNHDHALHSVTFGPDGLLYLNQGNAGAFVTDRSDRTFRVGSAYNGLISGETVPPYGLLPIEYAGAKSDDGHVYVGGFAMRIQPDGTNLEVIGYNFRNSYEQTVNSFGSVFQNDNDDPPASRTAYLLEYGSAGWFSRNGKRFWQADRRPSQDTPTAQWRQDDPGVMPSGDVYGAGAPTGIVFYEGDALGAKWRGTLLSCEAARNVVFGYHPKADGAGFELNRFKFLTSNEEEELAGTDALSGKVSNELKTFFRPSDVSVGPDGAIYVADWFDPRVGGHSDQDKTASGTIYRIAPKGFKSKAPKFDLSKVKGQIAALKSPAVNVRSLGFTRLKEAGEASVGPVSKLLKDDNQYIRGRAVWLLALLGDKGVAKVESLLADNDSNIRLTAFQALRRINHNVLKHAKTLAKDESAAVRREVAVAMRDVTFSNAKKILLTLANGYDGKDAMYLEAWGIGCKGKEAEVYEVLRKANKEKDSTKWTQAYAKLAWRLTPDSAVSDFLTRANSDSLSDQERIAAVTAIGFISTQNAADAMLSLYENINAKVHEQATWWLFNYRDIRWSDFGISEALKERGIYDPESIVVSGSVIPEQDSSKTIPVDSVLALTGDAGRGKALAVACTTCHQVGDAGVDYAPSLNGWASRQTTEVTIRAIVDPSSDIASGYGGREVLLNDGTVIHGRLISRSDPMLIRSMGGAVQMVPSERIKEINWYGRSLMLSADQLGLKAQDVADVVAYLKTLD